MHKRKLDDSESGHSKIHCNVPNEKISDEEWALIELNMYPGTFSCTGFLVEGEKLDDIIEKDEKTLKKLGITYDQIADRLEAIQSKYYSLLKLIHDETDCIKKGTLKKEDAIYINRENKKGDLLVEKNLVVSVLGYMGAQTCPFKNNELDSGYNGYSYGSSDITVTNTDLNKTFTYGTLLPHMIKAHHFFEGSVPYRVDPETVIAILGIEQGINYAPVHKYYDVWEFSSSCSHSLREHTDIEKENIFKAVEYYSHGYEKMTINNGRKEHQLNMFLSPDSDLYLQDNADIYLDSYEKKLPYKEFRRRIITKKNETYKEYNKKDPKFYEFPVLSDHEIERQCEEDAMFFDEQKEKKNLKKLRAHVYVTTKTSPTFLEWITGSVKEGTNDITHYEFSMFGLKVSDVSLSDYMTFKKTVYSHVDV
jgi:hypothetical protein